MALQYNLVANKDLARGLDLRSAESNIADGYSQDLQNVATSSSGQLSKRPGYQGYAGYVPFRVLEVSHDGYQLSFKLDRSVDLSGTPSSPIVVYGKLNTAKSGDFSTTAALRYYASFSVDVREVFSPASAPLVISAASHGYTTNDLAVYVLTSTSDANNSSSFAIADVSVDSGTYDVTVSYTPTSTERVFIVIVDRTAAAGLSYTADYSGSPLVPSGGTVTGTITAATHGLANFNIIPKIYDLDTGVYTEVYPDTFFIDDASGDVTFTLTYLGASFTGQVILSAAPADNMEQKSVPAGSTTTITVSTLDTDFPYWAFYRTNGGNLEWTLPDSVEVDAAAGTMTATITNASVSDEVYEFYYDFAEIAANTIRVVDSQAADVSYDSVFDPAVTIWGINHKDKYNSSAVRGGHVLHLDSYKRDAESRLVAGVGGNLYAARDEDEIGTTYQLPTLLVDLDARIASTASMAPLFQPTGTSTGIRTRGIITGDNVQDGYAVVTDAYCSGAGFATYLIHLPGKVGTLALNTQVENGDYFTVAGMSHDIFNGTFKIVGATDISSDTVSIEVINTNLFGTDESQPISDFDETGASGQGNVFSDKFTTLVGPTYVPGDVIVSESINSDLTLTVATISGTSVIVNGVTEAVALTQGLTVYGQRTGRVHSMKNQSETPSVQYAVVGDMVTVTDLVRQPRIVGVHPFHDMTCDVTVASGIATVSVGSTKTVASIDTATDYITSAAHGFIDNDPVQLSATEILPAALKSDAIYYVNYIDADNFQLLNKESGTVIDLADSGSGTITVTRVHDLHAGQRIIISQAGLDEIDGERIITSVPATNSFTFVTDAADTTDSGILVGYTLEFDESLTFMDGLHGATEVVVESRWIPIEAPTATGDLPASTYDTYFADTETTVRSAIVAGNMYLTNGNDEILKFDGTSLYQAGLFRWQPQLFVQLDTGTGSLVLDGSIAAGTTDCSGTNKFVLSTASAAGTFKLGDRIIHDSADNAVYTVKAVDTTAGLVFVDSTISSSDAAWNIKRIKTYKYYFRLNAYDANNNVIASAATGAIDFTVELSTAGQIRLRLVGMPVWGIYDYDRIELWVYRTVADTAAPFYRVRAAPIVFSAGHSYIDVWDGTTDEVLLQSGDLDSTMTALVGAELGTAWEQPPRAKYLTSVNNRLALANLKDYQQLDITLRKQPAAESVTTANLSGFKFTFRKSSTDSSTTTNMLNRCAYEFVTSGAVTITPATDISRSATTFTITKVAHGISAGHWVYLFHAAAGNNNDLNFAGWFQVASADADTFTFNFANSYSPGADDVDTYVCATSKLDIPVWLGTDGNYNMRFGNTSGSYEFHAALRLANAINASMVACDASLAANPDFMPWLTANAGSEYGLGQLIVRQPKYSSTTMEVLLGTIPTNTDIFVNNVKRASTAEVSANSLLFPSRVVISYENHPEIFDSPTADLADDSDSIVDVNSADGEEITGIVPFFGDSTFSASQVESLIVVFKTNSIYLLDVKTRSVQRIDSQGLGCTVPYSIAATRNGIMFANLSGIYRLNRNLTVSYVGKYVERFWKDTVNATNLAVATGHNYSLGQQYKLSVPVADDDTNSAVLVYDHTREGAEQEFGAWSRHTNHPATGWANLGDNSFFATTSGQIFKIRSANDSSDFRDDDSAVDEMVILMKAMDGGLPGIRKVCRNVILHMRMDKSSVTATAIDVATDNDGVFESAGNIAATLGTRRVESFRVSLPTTRFDYLQIRLTNSVKDENFVLAGVDLLLAALTQLGLKERSELT